ncbi:unnamed protein product, partial [Thlaspi arvense]
MLSLKMKKKNELWFHFESHRVQFWALEAAPQDNAYDWDDLKKESHITEDLVDKMPKAEKYTFNEKFSLWMLVLIETLLFGSYKEYKFPKSYIERAQDMNTLLNYHWGREAYESLLSSIKSRLPSHLERA